MRPIRLKIEAFGPFKDVEIIDFEALSQHQIFTVSGKTGSGKTAIFDAMFFALFGKLPGRRSSYDQFKSHYADDETVCGVEFDFYAKDKLWRVSRNPRYQRADIKTPTSAKSSLSEVTVDGAEPKVTRHSEVKDAVEKLIGLTAEQFERVVLIPQGEFKQILVDKLETRQELMRSLFGTEIFDDIKKEIDDKKKRLDSQAGDAKKALRDRINRHAKDLSDLEKSIDDSGTVFVARRVHIATGVDHNGGLTGSTEDKPAKDKKHKIEDVTFEDFSEATTELGSWLTRCGTHSSKLSQTLDAAQKLTSDVRHRLDLAKQEIQRRRRHEELTKKLVDYRNTEPQLRVRHDLAKQADSLRPLREAVKHNNAAQRSHDENVAGLQRDLIALETGVSQVNVNLLDTVALPKATHSDEPETKITDELRSRLETQLRSFAELGRTVKQLDSDTKQSQRAHQEAAGNAKRCSDGLQVHLESVAEIKSKLDSLGSPQDIETLQERCRSSVEKVEAARNVIAAAESLAKNLETQTSRNVLLKEVEVSIAESAEAQERLPQLRTELEETEKRLTELVEIDRLNSEIKATIATRDVQRSKADESRRQSDRVLNEYLSSAEVTLASHLQEGQPCGVCGSTEHPNPAQPIYDGSEVSKEDVTRAQEQAERQQAKYADIEAKLVSLKERVPEAHYLQDLTEQLQTLRHDCQQRNEAHQQNRKLAETLKEHQARALELDGEIRQLQEAHNQTVNRFVHNAALLPIELEAQMPPSELKQAIDEADFSGLETQAKNHLTQAEAKNRSIEDTKEQLEQATAEQQRLAEVKAAADTAEARADQTLIENRKELAEAREKLKAQGSKLFINPEPAQADIDTKLQQVHQLASAMNSHRQSVTRVETSSKNVEDAKTKVAELLQNAPIAAIAELDSIADISREQSEADKSAFIQLTTEIRSTTEELKSIEFSSETPPDIGALEQTVNNAEQQRQEAEKAFNVFTTIYKKIEQDLDDTAKKLEADRADNALLPEVETLQNLVTAGNSSDPIGLENWVLAKHLRVVTQLANHRLQRSTGGRFELVVQDPKDTGSRTQKYKGLEICVLDHSSEEPTPIDANGLSGGELFQASLALALGTADAVMQKTAATKIEAMFIDEGFGTLDEESLEMAIDVLSDLSCETTTVAVITHVKALLDVLPRGIEVKRLTGASGSTTKVFASQRT